MKLLLLFSLLMFVSCASRPERNIAGDEEMIELGEVLASKSVLRLYPPENQEQLNHLFYLELRNESSRLVDVDHRDIHVKHKNGNSDFQVKRLGKGMYQVEVSAEYRDLARLIFTVQGKALKNNLVTLPRPAKKYSQILVLSNQHHELKLRLILKDKLGKELEVAEVPEIQFEGLGEVLDLVGVGKGIWEFSVKYPEKDQIAYISVRSNGALLKRILRFQHVEK